MSMLHLSPADQRQLQHALRVLLTPFAHDGIDGWRRAVNLSLRRLLDADMATFVLALPGVARGYSDELGTEIASAAPDMFRSLQRRYRIARHAMRHGGAFTRAGLYYPHAAEIYRSEYYRDFIRPARAFDGLLLASGPLDAAMRPEPNLVDRPALLFNHDSPGKRRFGRRALRLLRIVHPTFEAATQLVLHRRKRHGDFVRMIDTLPGQLLLLGARGELLHRNRAAAAAPLHRTEAAQLHATAAHMARSLASEQRHGEHDPASSTCDVDAGPCRFRLRAAFAPEGLRNDGPTVLISVEQLDSVCDSRLRKRFTLTRQEARVARFLGNRRSNAEIARTLSISEHTARHHTERVLAKLGAKRRTDVEAILRVCQD